MSHQHPNNLLSSPRKDPLALSFLCVILVIYFGALGWLGQSTARSSALWGRFLLPNLWLLGGSLLLKKLLPIKVWLFSRGQWPKVWAVLTGIGASLIIFVAINGPLNNQSSTELHQMLFHLVLITLVPLAEEIYFRGLLLHHFKQTMNSYSAIALVSSLFGMLHLLSGWPMALAMTLLSAVLCIITLLSHTVLWAIAWHLSWNAMSVVKHPLNASSRWTIVAVSMMALVIISFWGMVIRQSKGEYHEPTSHSS